MRLLARYLMRECLVALGYCFSAFLLLWVSLDLLSSLHDLQENKLRAGDVAEYYLFRIPEFLPVALPVAILLALLYALTNHARHNEITAIRAAGVSLWRLSLPYFAIGLLAAVALFASNEFLAPKTAEVAEQILIRRVQRQRSDEERLQVSNLAFENATAGRFWRIGIYNPRTGEMIRPSVNWRRPDGTRQQFDAERATYTNGCWTFYNVSGWKKTATTNSLMEPIKKATLPMPEFAERPEEINSQISVMDRIAHPTRTHRADIPIAEIINYLHFNPNPEASIRSRLFTKLHGRFAGPFTCIVVVMMALPFAAASNRRNVFVGVAASLFIFFVYFMLQQVGFAMGEVGRIPAWLGAWFPNLLFGIAGLWMVARVR